MKVKAPRFPEMKEAMPFTLRADGYQRAAELVKEEQDDQTCKKACLDLLPPMERFPLTESGLTD